MTSTVQQPHAIESDQTPSTAMQAQHHVQQLATEALRHRAVHHPYLLALGNGALPDPLAALQDFARHYHGYSLHFPRYLTAVISRLDNPQHRRALLDNLNEESGQYGEADLAILRREGIEPEWILGIPHPELFERFRQALGCGAHAPEEEHIEVTCWREQFLGILSQGSAAEAVGALGLGTEGIVQSIYQPIRQAVNRLGTLQPQDCVFFPLHTCVDDDHQETLRRIACDFATTDQGRRDLAKGMHKALSLRDSFWSWLHRRAMEHPHPLDGRPPDRR